MIALPPVGALETNMSAHCGIDIREWAPGGTDRLRQLQFVAAADPVLPILKRLLCLLLSVQPRQLG